MLLFNNFTIFINDGVPLFSDRTVNFAWRGLITASSQANQRDEAAGLLYARFPCKDCVGECSNLTVSSALRAPVMNRF